VRIERLVGVILARRWSVLAIVLLVTLVLAWAGAHLEFRTSPETILQTSDEAILRLREHEDVFGTYERRLVLVCRRPDVFDPAELAKLGRATDRLAALSITERARSLVRCGFPLPDPVAAPEGFRDAVLGNRLLSPFLVSKDGKTASIHVDLRPEADAAAQREESIGTLVRVARECGLDPLVAGVPAVRRAYAVHIRDDIIFLPPAVTLVLSLLFFIALRRLLPIVGLQGAVALAAVWTLGLLSLTGGRITALTSILPALIMVVGVATGVHVVAQFREELARGATRKAASRIAVTKMLLPCGLTALTTAVGFSSLIVTGIRDVREFGLYSAMGVLLAFVIGVPLLGIMLSFGTTAPRDVHKTDLPMGRPLVWLSNLLARRPWIGIAAGVAPAILSVIGITQLRNETFLLEDIRPGEPIHQAVLAVDRDLGGLIGFDLVITSDDSLLSPKTFAWLRELEEDLRDLDGVRTVVGPETLRAEIDRMAGAVPGMLLHDSPLPPARAIALVEGAGGGDLVATLVSPDRRMVRIIVRPGDLGSVRFNRIREEAVALAARATPDGVSFRAGGYVLLAERVLARLVREMGKSLALAFVVIFILMSVLFKSVRVGALSMIPNFLPLLVAAGYMGFMGITIRSSIALIFAVALGLAVDDTIHMLTRYLRERRAGRSSEEAVDVAIRWTGRPVILTSGVLFFGFLTFLISGFRATADFGSISAVTIAAAIVGDLVLLPAMLLIWPPRTPR
jgi:uncharacterized protein